MKIFLLHPSSLRLLFIALFVHGAGAGALPKPDWLIQPAPFAARIVTNAARHEISLENGLVRRVFRLQPNAATVAFDNLMTGEEK